MMPVHVSRGLSCLLFSLPRLSQARLQHAGCLAILVLWGSFLFFPRLGDRDLNASHEGRAAQNAQVLLTEGSWGLPRLFDRRVELQKPPLYYWLVAGLAYWRGVGVDTWAVRLPAALAGLGGMLVLYGLGKRTSRANTGWLAALILATCVHYTWLARVGRIDMPLTLAVTVAVVCFFLGQRPRTPMAWRWPWFVVFYLAVALGILLKGPIALLLPTVVIVGWSWWERQWRPFLATLWWGVPLLLTVAAPWFVWANGQTNNRLWEVFFWYHNVERGLGSDGPLASHPWWFYFPRVLLDLLPWSLLMPPALWVSWKHNWFRADPLLRLGTIWFGAQMLFLSLMRFKRADYLLPAYPGAALFLACVLGSWLRKNANNNLTRRSRNLWGKFSTCLICRGKLETCPTTSPHPAVKIRGKKLMGKVPSSPFQVPAKWLVGLLIFFIIAPVVGWFFFLHVIEPHQADFAQARCFAMEIRRRTSQPVIFFRAEAHAVAFHVGPPLDTILEWENLDVWAKQPQTIYMVMPPDCANSWREQLPTGRLEEVLRSTALPTDDAKPGGGWLDPVVAVVRKLGWLGHQGRPLVLMRSIPK